MTTRLHAIDAGYDIVHARMLDRFPELVVDLGGDPALFSALGHTDWETHSSDRPAITYREFFRRLEDAARILACPDFGMRLAARQNAIGIFGPLGQVMRNSRNFGEALDYVSKHAYAHSLAARVWLEPVDGGGSVFSGHDILLDGAGDRQQAIEHILLAGHLSAMELTAGRARARKVHFRHEPVSGFRTYRRYFGCDVVFGEAADGITFCETDLAAPIETPDERAFKEMTAYIEERFTQRTPPVHAQVRAAIVRLIGSGNCSTDQVASALCLHIRTLHRRLKEEGTSFRSLKDDVRRNLLRYYLQRTDLDLSTISEKLGFAEQSVMSRFCQRWLCTSPSMLRTRLRRS